MSTRAEGHVITERCALHASAVAAYVASAERIPSKLWNVPLKADKWSPAEVTQHLRLSFEAMIRELQGMEPMKFRAGRLARWVIRLTYMRRLLAGGAFPAGARAPRETRPQGEPDIDAAAALMRLREEAAAFEALTAQVHAGDRRATLTHPYFGSIRLTEALLISSRHVDHHRSQIEAR